MLTHIENNANRLKGVDAELLDKMFNIGVFCKTVPFLVEMKQFGNNTNSLKLYKKLKNTELAVFDDISAVPMSNYDYNILYALVESRIWEGLPSIFTTNITSLSELQKEVGPRLAERIWKTSTIIELRGEGYRGI
jgi:DNA replication protein DnaC